MKPDTAQQLASAYVRAWKIYKGESCTVIPSRGYFLVSSSGRFRPRRTAAELIKDLSELLHFDPPAKDVDARLIAAAPALLAAIKCFVVTYETNMPPPGYSPDRWKALRDQCRAALALAE